MPATHRWQRVHRCNHRCGGAVPAGRRRRQRRRRALHGQISQHLPQRRLQSAAGFSTRAREHTVAHATCMRGAAGPSAPFLLRSSGPKLDKTKAKDTPGGRIRSPRPPPLPPPQMPLARRVGAAPAETPAWPARRPLPPPPPHHHHRQRHRHQPAGAAMSAASPQPLPARRKVTPSPTLRPPAPHPPRPPPLPLPPCGPAWRSARGPRAGASATAALG